MKCEACRGPLYLERELVDPSRHHRDVSVVWSLYCLLCARCPGDLVIERDARAREALYGWCAHGHLLDPENLGTDKKGYPVCKTCVRVAQEVYASTTDRTEYHRLYRLKRKESKNGTDTSAGPSTPGRDAPGLRGLHLGPRDGDGLGQDAQEAPAACGSPEREA